MIDTRPLLVALLLVGCAPEVADDPADSRTPVPFDARISIVSEDPAAPGLVDFGEVLADEVKEHLLTVTNHGEGFVTIHDYRAPRVERVLVDADFPLSVPEDERILLPLRFAPYGDMSLSGLITFETDDRARPEIFISVLGEALAPFVTFTPDQLDFGEVEIGCAVTREVVLRNDGRASVQVDAARVSTPGTENEVAVTGLPDAGAVLQPGEERVLEVVYSPTFEWDHVLFVDLDLTPRFPDAEFLARGEAVWTDGSCD